MRSGSRTQGTSTHSAAHEAVGNFSLAGSSGMRQAQPSSTAGYQSYQARYETNEFRAPEQQGLQDNMISGCRLDDSGEQHHSQRNNGVEQNRTQLYLATSLSPHAGGIPFAEK